MIIAPRCKNHNIIINYIYAVYGIWLIKKIRYRIKCIYGERDATDTRYEIEINRIIWQLFRDANFPIRIFILSEKYRMNLFYLNRVFETLNCNKSACKIDISNIISEIIISIALSPIKIMKTLNRYNFEDNDFRLIIKDH